MMVACRSIAFLSSFFVEKSRYLYLCTELEKPDNRLDNKTQRVFFFSFVLGGGEGGGS